MNTKTTIIFKNVVKVTIYCILIIFLGFLGTKSYEFGKAVFTDDGYHKKPGEDITAVINGGDSSMDVAKELENDGIVKSAFVFYVQSIIYESNFVPGTYTLNSSQGPEEIIEILSAGQNATDSSEE